jgi:tripartite-type tricarboxylate transporter receptor subunit TctC
MRIVHVPYQGSAGAMNDLIAGNVQVALDTVAVTRPHIEAGRLRLIAVGSLERLAFFPDTPTIAEQGYPGFEADAWLGMLLPAGTPKETVERLSAAPNKIVRSPENRRKFLGAGTLAKSSTSAEFAAFLKAEYARWGKAIAESGIKAD